MAKKYINTMRNRKTLSRAVSEGSSTIGPLNWRGENPAVSLISCLRRWNCAGGSPLRRFRFSRGRGESESRAKWYYLAGGV